MRVRRGVAMCLALIGLTLGACSDGDEPATLPEVTPDGSPTTSVPSPPATPTGDPTADLEAEITAFYEDYVQTINESWTSPEALDRRREMFADSCTVCRQGYDLTAHAHAEGLTLEEGQGMIRDVRVDAVEGNVVTFLAIEDVAAGRLVDESGRVIEEFGETAGAHVVYRAHRDPADRWIMIASDLLSVEGGGDG